MRKAFEQMTPEERVEHIASEARFLVAMAEEIGVVLRISHKPRQPLMTGNIDHVVEAWPARHGPRARPAP